ncbi:MAG: hypothetical protein AB8B36_09795 [Prochlorococcus sp.]
MSKINTGLANWIVLWVAAGPLGLIGSFCLNNKWLNNVNPKVLTC